MIAGAKAVRNAGYIDGFHWAFNINDLCQAVSHLGPAVVGTSWLNSMFDPDPQGLLEVDFGSGDAGGHCYLVSGILLESPIAHGAPLLRIRNSWARAGAAAETPSSRSATSRSSSSATARRASRTDATRWRPLVRSFALAGLLALVLAVPASANP